MAARPRAGAAMHRVHRVATQDAEAPLRPDAAMHRVHRETTGDAEVPLLANAATHRGWPRLKRLSELGSALEHGNGFRARIKLARREQHIGPLRHTEAEALSDLAEMRGANSRADVGLVAARLRANAAAHRVQRDVNAATGHADASATGHAPVSTAGGDLHLVEGRRVSAATGRNKSLTEVQAWELEEELEPSQKDL